MKRFIPLIGRILLSAIFLMSGLNKITNFGGTEKYMAAVGMPLTKLFLISAIILEVIGGLSILLGYKAKWGAWALVIFLIPATLIFHSNFSDQIQMIMLMKNLAMIGGLLMVANFGAGAISLDTRQK